MRAGGGGGGLLDREQNPLQRLVAQHVSGANPKNCYPLCREPGLATLVMTGLRNRIVREAVNLDRETSMRAVEVENVRADRVLAAETQPRQPSFPQGLPEHDLG